jgi:hypothetical protein
MNYTTEVKAGVRGFGLARLCSIFLVIGSVAALDYLGGVGYGKSLPQPSISPESAAQQLEFPPAAVQKFPTAREVALVAHKGVAQALSVNALYRSRLVAGGIEPGSAGFHLAEPDYICKQPPQTIEKTGTDGRNYYLLDRNDGNVVPYSGHHYFTSLQVIPPSVPDKTHRGSVSIQKPLGDALFSGTAIPDASGQGVNLHFQLNQRGITLLLGHTDGAIMPAAGYDWAGEWRQAGSLITPFDLVLVADNKPIGYLPARDMLEALTYGGRLLDIETSMPVLLTDASASAILNVF